MVCGPIDEYVSICTDITIPGGTNVMIEVTRMAIGILAEKLAAIGFVIPKNLGVQYDNCGENKVRLPPNPQIINIFCCANYYYFFDRHLEERKSLFYKSSGGRMLLFLKV